MPTEENPNPRKETKFEQFRCHLKCIKERLGKEIAAHLKREQLTQREAAQVMGVSQPDVAALKGGKYEKFSLERLLSFLAAIGHRIVLSVHGKHAAKPTSINIEMP